MAGTLTEELAASTDGYSFAYLKELVTATLQRFVGREGPFEVLAREDQLALRGQMKTGASDVTTTATDIGDEDD